MLKLRDDTRERHRFPGLSAIARTILKLLALIFFASPCNFQHQSECPRLLKLPRAAPSPPETLTKMI
jgi:hypothetical protein